MSENKIIENNAEELEPVMTAECEVADSAVEQTERTDIDAEDVAAIASAEEQKARSKEAELAALRGFNWKKFWDKVTTGLLIFLLSSPFLVLIYIVLWFTVLR